MLHTCFKLSDQKVKVQGPTALFGWRQTLLEFLFFAFCSISVSWMFFLISYFPTGNVLYI